jgi:NitT/TauT family transport system permease protein
MLIVISSLFWVPLGILIGLRPRPAEKIQPLAHFRAVFLANLLFPLFVVGIVYFKANPDIWTSPLIVLGTQWYILFNVIAGVTALPIDLREAVTNSGCGVGNGGATRCCRRVPIFFITGAITSGWRGRPASLRKQWPGEKRR